MRCQELANALLATEGAGVMARYTADLDAMCASDNKVQAAATRTCTRHQHRTPHRSPIPFKP